jgi:predicted GNAT superfamily acetyltransferase
MIEEVSIRLITTLPELRRIEILQRDVWGMPDRDVVPSHQLLAANGAGGVVLGAFVPSGDLVGFCYGFIGLRNGRALFYSHMAAVVEAHRGKNIGFRLKRAQREEAMARGLDWMVWTYDPLQAANAHLNMHKLGARASRYYVNYYGEMDDELNRGIPSDRLEVDWWLRDPRVVRLMRGERSPAPSAGDAVRIDVPANLGEIRRSDPAQLRQWRQRTREGFMELFARGYEAVDFVDGAYVLRLKEPEPR